MPKYVVNSACVKWAKEAISKGQINDGPWGIDAADKQKMLAGKTADTGKDGKDWEFYSQHFLAFDPDQPKDTEERYHYPVGKENAVYVHAVNAIRSRASESGETDIYNAAGEIEQAIKDYELSKSADAKAKDDGKTSPAAAKEVEPERSLPTELEYRAMECRLSSSDDQGNGTITGTIRFNSLSSDLGGFMEKIDPHAFDQSLAEANIVCLYQHDRQRPLASQRSGTLKIEKTADAITYSAKLPSTSYAQDMRALMSGGHKELQGSSFGFQTVEDSWSKGDLLPVRTIKRAKLVEISPVTDPAYPKNSLNVRSITIPDAAKVTPEVEPKTSPKILPLSTARKIIQSKKA